MMHRQGTDRGSGGSALACSNGPATVVADTGRCCCTSTLRGMLQHAFAAATTKSLLFRIILITLQPTASDNARRSAVGSKTTARRVYRLLKHTMSSSNTLPASSTRIDRKAPGFSLHWPTMNAGAPRLGAECAWLRSFLLRSHRP